jgi:uncharacterized membrane protein
VNLPARLRSVDVARGLVMVLMAIDHVRVYSGLPAGGPTPGIFFTRWVTHFCAPAFVFLAGTSAYLHGAKLGDRGALSRFLFTRGLWLVLLELTLVRLAWTFNVRFDEYLLAGVIWVLGWSMVVLAGLVWLPLWVSAGFGALLVFGHNFLPQDGASGVPGWLWQLVYGGGPIGLGEGGPTLFVLYVLVPWVGVMALGYVFGAVLRLEPARRDRACYLLGLSATVLFLVLRATSLYGDPRPWGGPNSGGQMPALLAFLNAAKYPASLQFLLMTLGPTLLVLPWFEHTRGRVSDALVTFGKVPLFYYLLHIPLIHILAIGYTAIRMPSALSWHFENHPIFVPAPPEGYTWSLLELYVVTVLAVAILYPACRWFAARKARGGSALLSYL